MKTATLRELRTRYSTVMKWIEVGEQVKISKRGKVVARLVPVKQEKPTKPKKVDWSTSAAVMQDKSKWPMMTEFKKNPLIPSK